ncbi:hypothetical protein LJC27_01405 [Christensenellaceae bacterium OttesenSCG-928-M15]|nr:hypothetical protein [Christensenellaceae bacterium OttesenSCG-928-M15]
MKFQYGDKVCILKELKENGLYGGLYVDREMAAHAGEAVTVRFAARDIYVDKEHSLFWTEEMLEKTE